jgi:hypothetical protein
VPSTGFLAAAGPWAWEDKGMLMAVVAALTAAKEKSRRFMVDLNG